MLNIEIFSDVVCPWCFVGKRRLEQALALVRRGHPGREIDVRVTWRPFELNPGLPREGVDRAAYRRAKFGSLERSQLLDARLVDAGESAGIAFAFDKIKRTPNTFDAHRLVWLADSLGGPEVPGPAGMFGSRRGPRAKDAQTGQDALVEALFRAYFLDGLNVGEHAVLEDLAEGSGIPRARAASLLAGREGEAEVRTEENRAWTSGIQGVPHFIIGGTHPISGAQNPAIIAAAIQDVLRATAEA
ncbi:MAG TPA: DsbA family oxidoreductase [bacterium]|nr:DsbA family oxidoreductase [bacterium]